jgi:translation initiation factor IF-2
LTKKKLKLNIKNAQIAGALNLSKLKKVTTKKKSSIKTTTKPKARVVSAPKKETPKPKVRLIKKKIEEPIPEKIEAETKPIIPKTEKAEVVEVKKQIGKKVEEKPKEKPKEEPKEEPKKEPEAKKAPPTTPPKKELKKPVFKTTEIKPNAPKSDLKEFKLSKKHDTKHKSFDTRHKSGLRFQEEDNVWRRRKSRYKRYQVKEKIEIVRPKELTIQAPISIKELASQMKLKATELISKLFLQGMAVTLNDELDDETTIQLLGHEFDCEIKIDKTEEKRLQITDKTILEEVKATSKEDLILRPPIITFMGHVDHGKTSLIDAIRESNITTGEAGKITQHIGAFTAKTSDKNITILDTPGHEAFTEMRKRGSTVTDIIILVIAGDEGIKEQTSESINCAKQTNVPIIVAINKSDKAGFDPEKIYRQLADHNLIPEAWGGTVITVNCSAITKQGIPDLLEMIALQAEVCELRANPKSRARGTILESQMHKGLGAVATILIQNGSLKKGDSIVFGTKFGRIKTMQDQHNNPIEIAPPSTPVKITGLSDIADAGCEFIAVKDEKQAKDIAHNRQEGVRRKKPQALKAAGLESLLQQEKENKSIKILPLILRADVQGSLEALRVSLEKIHSKKVNINIISEEVGEISESDIQLSAASNAPIIGFHTRLESHAEPLKKQKKVTVKLNNIIYHAVDDVKLLMKNTLDKTEHETDKGKARVKVIFKSSHLGQIAGCDIVDGIVSRNHYVRQIRNGKQIWKGKMGSIKREKDDVKEVSKGTECGIILDNNTDVQVGDIFECYEITYMEQDI